MANKKIESYLGFALKSGICSKGSELALSDIRNKMADVVLISNNATDNTKKAIINGCNTHKVVYSVCDSSIFDRLINSNIKTIAIKKSELSKQIKKIILAGENE